MSKYSKKFRGEQGPATAGSSTTATDKGSKTGRHRLERRGASSEASAARKQPLSSSSATSEDSETVNGQAQSGSRGEAPPAEANQSTGDGGPTLDETDVGKREENHDGRDEAETDEEGDSERDDEDDIDAAVRGDESPSSDTTSTVNGLSGTLYTCDICAHLVFHSVEALQRHAIKAHAEVFPDYTRLCEVSTKLIPLWSQVMARKADTIAMWGRKIFHIARTRDAGADKMAEALRAREQLEHVVRRWHSNARVFIFGSSVALGVWDGISDVDFAVVDVEEHEAGTWPPMERNAVRAITELLRRAGFSYVNLEPIPYARVPIIKHHASAPIRVAPASVATATAASAAATSSASVGVTSDRSTNRTVGRREPTAAKSLSPAELAEASRLEAEDVVARSVRYVLTAPASRQDRLVLEGSVRDAVGADAVQQVWWNRSGEMMCVTCDTTLSAMRAATCGLSFASPGMRARVQPVHDECRPELYNVDFDLSFRAFGIRNSELLNRYLTAHPCARPGAIVLKDWSKTSGVNNSMNGYLTSYAVNIMWIYYLVQKGVVPYVDPINDVPASLVGRDNFGPIYRPMLPPDGTPAELEALYRQAGELLLGFFYFYAHEFNWCDHVVSLNRRGITTKRSLGWDTEEAGSAIVAAAASSNSSDSNGVHGSAAGSGGSGIHAPPRKVGAGGARYSFCIEDPYEENLNLGRHMGVTKSLRVQAELHRGLLSLLKDGEHDSCVFASTDRTEAASAATPEHQLRHQQPKSQESNSTTGHDSQNGGGLLTPSSTPGRLPLAVLHRLMAIAIKEVAAAKQRDVQQLQQLQPQQQQEQQQSRASAGLRQEQLRAAFEYHAPVEYQLACKAWNWQQLIHRLGYKLHQGCVVPRREIGVRRLSRNPQPPSGVVPASPSTGADASTGGGHAVSNASEGSVTDDTHGGVDAAAVETIRAGGAPMGLSERMAAALASGFLRLTPEWVAWSKPWAAVHLRNYTFFTPRITGTATSTSASATSTSTTATTTAASMTFPSSNNAATTAAAAGSGGGGVRPTQPRLMRWHAGGLLPSPPSLSPTVVVRRAGQVLLHR